MKIWYQSSVDFGVDPVWNDYLETLNTHFRQIARSDTEIMIHGVKAFTPVIQKVHLGELLIEPQFVEAAINAQQEDYDAFCVGCALDPAYYEVSEVLDMPVCFLSETAMHLASLLGNKFAILSYNEFQITRLTEIARRYGLQDKLVPSDSFDIPIPKFHQAFNNPQIFLDSAEKVAKEANENGAGILITTSGVINGVLRKHGITEIGGVPVLEGSGALIKMAELMVDLAKIGIKRSKLAFPPVTKTELAEIRKTFSGVSII